MAMFLVSMESYDNGQLGNIQFKAPFGIPDREILVLNQENREKRDFFVGGPKMNIFEI